MRTPFAFSLVGAQVRTGLLPLLVVTTLYPTVHAAVYEWDGGAGSNLWADSVFIPGSGFVTNWSPENAPVFDDVINLTAASTTGPVAIDLNGPQSIEQLSADGVNGTYTFANSGEGALTIVSTTTSETVITRNGSGLTIDADLLLDSAGTLRLNVQSTGGKITVKGDVASSASAGTTILMPTVVNTTLPVGVEINGVISDGTAQTALSAGFNGNISHTGTVRLTGANTYTGATRVYIGTLEFNSIADIAGGANALGQPASGDSAIRLGTAATGTSAATLRYIGAGDTSNRVIELAGKNNDTARIESSGTGPLVLTGGVENPANGQFLELGGTNTGANTLSGTIQPGVGAAVTSLRKNGVGKWILSGNSANLDGSVTINDGQLVLAGALGSTTANTGRFLLASGGSFTLDGGYLAVSDINQAAGGTFDFQSGTVRVVSAAAANGVVAGPLAIGTDGPGLLQLQGGSKTFGDVTLHGADDRLEIDGSGTFAFNNLDNSVGGIVTGGSAAKLQINGLFTYRTNGGASSFNSQITGTGGFTKQGPGTLEFAATPVQHAYTGTTRIEQGTLKLTGAPGLPDTSPLFIDAAGTFDLTEAVGGDQSGRISGTGRILTAPNASLGIGTNGQSADFGGQISGGGGLVKRGAGAQTLSGINTYTGSTLVEDGVLVVTGSLLGTSSLNLNDGPAGNSQTLTLAGGAIVTPGKLGADQTGAVLNIESGSLTANQIDMAAGSDYDTDLNWIAGSIRLTNAVGVHVGVAPGIDQPFQNSLDLDTGKSLIIDNTTTVGASGTLAINGGTLSTGTLTKATGGAFEFNSGTLRFTQDQTIDAEFAERADVGSLIQAGRTLEVTGQATLDALLGVAGGTVRFGSVVHPENLILSSGVLEVTAGDLSVAAGKSIDATTGMVVNVANGALHVAAGASFNAINASLSFSDDIDNNGAINLINSTVDGNLINAPSASVSLLGTNAFGDSLALSGRSSVFIDIAGDQLGEFDVLTIGGDATLGGRLLVSFDAAFSPAVGDAFQIVDIAGASSGRFTGLANGALLGTFGGVDLFIDYAAGDGNDVALVTAPATWTADADGDGDVDGADFLTIQRTDGGLLSDWQIQFGVRPRTQIQATQIPEPTTLLLLGARASCPGRKAKRRSKRGMHKQRHLTAPAHPPAPPRAP